MAWVNPAIGRRTRAFSSTPVRNPATGVSEPHNGEDVAPPTPGQRGVLVHATSSGEVVGVGAKLLGGRSGDRNVLIDHGGGIRSYYGHLEEARVTRGQRVEAGQMIGIMGERGNVTAIHLHFEILQNGRPVDPVAFLRARGVALGAGPTQPPDGGTPSNPIPTQEDDEMGIIVWTNGSAFHVGPASGLFQAISPAQAQALAATGVTSRNLGQADFDELRAYCRTVRTNGSALNTVIGADGSVIAVR